MAPFWTFKTFPYHRPSLPSNLTTVPETSSLTMKNLAISLCSQHRSTYLHCDKKDNIFCCLVVLSELSDSTVQLCHWWIIDQALGFVMSTPSHRFFAGASAFRSLMLLGDFLRKGLQVTELVFTTERPPDVQRFAVWMTDCCCQMMFGVSSSFWHRSRGSFSEETRRVQCCFSRQIKHDVLFHTWGARRVNVAWKCPRWRDARVGSLVALKHDAGTTCMVTSVRNYSRGFLPEAEFRLRCWRILVSWIQWLFAALKHALGRNKCHRKPKETT